MANNSRTLINLIGLPLTLFLIYIGGISFNIIIYLAIIISTKEFNDISYKKNINLNLLWIYFSYLLLFIASYFDHNIFSIK